MVDHAQERQGLELSLSGAGYWARWPTSGSRPRAMPTPTDRLSARNPQLRKFDQNGWQRPEDEVVSHAFSHGFHPEHSERLAAYWAEALGGPTTFSAEYGDESSVVRTHS